MDEQILHWIQYTCNMHWACHYCRVTCIFCVKSTLQFRHQKCKYEPYHEKCTAGPSKSFPPKWYFWHQGCLGSETIFDSSAQNHIPKIVMCLAGTLMGILCALRRFDVPKSRLFYQYSIPFYHTFKELSNDTKRMAVSSLWRWLFTENHIWIETDDVPTGCTTS